MHLAKTGRIGEGIPVVRIAISFFGVAALLVAILRVGSLKLGEGAWG
jgi:hypothetical protein